MAQIWKFQLDTYTDSIVAPINWTPLSVHVQDGVPCLWAIVDDFEPRKKHRVAIVGTGHNAEHVVGMKFIGTFLLENGLFALHVFVA